MSPPLQANVRELLGSAELRSTTASHALMSLFEHEHEHEHEVMLMLSEIDDLLRES